MENRQILTIVYFKMSVDTGLDAIITEAMSKAGFVFRGSGYNMITEKRDLSFELPK